MATWLQVRVHNVLPMESRRAPQDAAEDVDDTWHIQRHPGPESLVALIDEPQQLRPQDFEDHAGVEAVPPLVDEGADHCGEVPVMPNGLKTPKCRKPNQAIKAVCGMSG